MPGLYSQSSEKTKRTVLRVNFIGPTTIVQQSRAFGKRLITILLLLLGVSVAYAQGDKQDNTKLTVIIEGVEDDLKNNVEINLEINKLNDKAPPSEARLQWLHGRAKEDIERALQPFGYYKPTIDKSLRQTPEGWEARYRIEPGPPLPIASLDVQVLGEGRDDPRFQKLLSDVPIAKGQTLEHPRYEELKQSLQVLATERGYFDAEMTRREVRVDLNAYSAAVILHFDTGRRYQFGEVFFEQDILNQSFLQRYVDIKPGDPYRASSLLQLQSDLIDSEYFSQVEVGTPLDKAVDKQLPINVTLTPRERTKYSVGLGFGTDTGVRASAGVERRWVNRRGHRFETKLQASQIKYGIAGEYTIPGGDPRNDEYALRASVVQESSDIKDTFNTTIGGRYRYKDGLWQKTNALDYIFEEFDFSGEITSSTLLVPSIDWTRIDADNRLNVTDGNRLSLMLRGVHKVLISDVTFIQAALSSKWIKSLGDNGRIILRGDVGSTFLPSQEDFDNLPASLRFFAGGDNSVRGYTLDSIGPRNDENDVIGGKHLLVGSIEYEHRVKEKWSVAAFVDSGDAFDDENPELKTGVGVGVRWQSPVGPIRVDLASGLDAPGDTIRLHINIGPDL